MALIAEELVEEWLNRQGFFTIRGIKLGVHEIDLLAIRHTTQGLECRQVEVQASVRPISYVSRLPRAVQKATGRGPVNAKVRDESEVAQGVHEWIEKKFDHREKVRLRNLLAPGPWSRELVVHRVKYESEVGVFEAQGITVRRLSDIVSDLTSGRLMLEGAAGAHLLDLVAFTGRADARQ
jgi:hypothetical protein